MEAEGKATSGTAIADRRPRRLWLWFGGGFLLVFVGMLLLVQMTAMHPSGQYVVQAPLWLHYAHGIPRLFEPSTLGPASGGRSALLETALVHVLFSVGGGLVTLVIRWLRL